MTDSFNGWESQQIPYSQEAEEATIGAVLVNPVAYFGVASFLQPDDFFILRHKYIWQALARLVDRSEPIDYLTLTQELKDMDKLAEIGGQAYLTQLINSTPTSVHAEIYGRLVERAAKTLPEGVSMRVAVGAAVQRNVAIRDRVGEPDQRPAARPRKVEWEPFAQPQRSCIRLRAQPSPSTRL